MAVYRKLIEGIKKILTPAKRPKTTHTESTLRPQNSAKSHAAYRISRDEHTVSRKQISKNALKVLYKLNQAGYEAYLVGGCVRDILLDKQPKDFDVVTNAHPDEVNALFRNCRLIGRRFVLAHIHFGREIIEVATFRAQHDSKKGEGVMVDGRIVRDNVYGTLEDDIWRRDFTTNALYYDISDFSIIDYADGLYDLDDGILRLIGDPMQRYQEDPVRMLRATRFAAKLDFEIESQTAAPIEQLGHLLAGVPPARLYEEVLKLFLTGHAAQSFEQLQKFHLFEHLFPQTNTHLDEEFAQTLIQQVLQNTDERIAEQKTVTPAFLFMSLLWPPMLPHVKQLRAQDMTEQDSIIGAGQIVLQIQAKHVFIPKRIVSIMQEIWLLQPRLTRRKDKRCFSVLEHPRFRAAYDFLVLRAAAGEEGIQESVDWWDNFQTTEQHDRHEMVQQRYPRRPRKRNNQKRNKTTNSIDSADNQSTDSPADNKNEEA
ncbi:MAG: polynucleotide adenylyltransferase PcnB [Thiotrichaceae bacterium]|nr:polynucleotide adenylyltransferase PcnB [Thiotrichaceae bacterium]